jgi:hypothetical protein
MSDRKIDTVPGPAAEPPAEPSSPAGSSPFVEPPAPIEPTEPSEAPDEAAEGERVIADEGERLPDDDGSEADLSGVGEPAPARDAESGDREADPADVHAVEAVVAQIHAAASAAAEAAAAAERAAIAAASAAEAAAAAAATAAEASAAAAVAADLAAIAAEASLGTTTEVPPGLDTDSGDESSGGYQDDEGDEDDDETGGTPARGLARWTSDRRPDVLGYLLIPVVTIFAAPVLVAILGVVILGGGSGPPAICDEVRAVNGCEELTWSLVGLHVLGFLVLWAGLWALPWWRGLRTPRLLLAVASTLVLFTAVLRMAA